MDTYIQRLARTLDAARAANRPLRASMVLESGTTVGGVISEVSDACVVIRSDKDGAVACVRPDAVLSYVLKDA